MKRKKNKVVTYDKSNKERPVLSQEEKTKQVKTAMDFINNNITPLKCYLLITDDFIIWNAKETGRTGDMMLHGALDMVSKFIRERNVQSMIREGFVENKGPTNETLDDKPAYIF